MLLRGKHLKLRLLQPTVTTLTNYVVQSTQGHVLNDVHFWPIHVAGQLPHQNLSSVQLGKHLSDMFPSRNGLEQRDVLSPLFFRFALQYAITRIQINQDGLIIKDT